MKSQCVVFGAGGHSRSVIFALRRAGINPLWAIDTVSKKEDEHILGVPVKVDSDLIRLLKSMDVSTVYLAIGDNSLRQKYFEELRLEKYLLPNFQAISAIVSEDIQWGEGNIVLEKAYIGPESHLGDNNIINTGAIIEHQCKIGSHNHLAPGALLAGSVIIGDGNFLGLGSGVIPQIKIGAQVTLGAMGLLRSHTPENGTYVGVPARKK